MKRALQQIILNRRKFVGLLDLYPAELYFGMRLVKASFADTDIWQVRRPNNDTVLVKPDLGLSNPAISQNSPIVGSSTLLGDFLGSGDGWITEIKSQGSINVSAVQADTTKQPKIATGGIIENINGSPSALFGANTFLSTTSSIPLLGSNSLSIFYAAKILDTFNDTAQNWLASAGNGFNFLAGNVQGDIRFTIRNSSGFVGLPLGNPNDILAGETIALSAIYDGSSCKISKNQVQLRSGAASGGILASSPLTIGVNPVSALMKFSEIILSLSDVTLFRNVITANQQIYLGI